MKVSFTIYAVLTVIITCISTVVRRERILDVVRREHILDVVRREHILDSVTLATAMITSMSKAVTV